MNQIKSYVLDHIDQQQYNSGKRYKCWKGNEVYYFNSLKTAKGLECDRYIDMNPAMKSQVNQESGDNKTSRQKATGKDKDILDMFKKKGLV
jgi:hypothetical protein